MLNLAFQNSPDLLHWVGWAIIPLLMLLVASIAVIRRDRMAFGQRLLLTLVALVAGSVANRAEAAVTIPRGRPVINAAHTTFVADNGNRLRGAAVVPNITGLQQLKQLGQNAVHYYAEGFDPNYPASGSKAPGYNLKEMDDVVKMTHDLGIYLIMTIGNQGGYNRQFALDFWKTYAPRYANETHVIYEIQNEPVAWSPPYNSPNANPPGAVEMNVAVYKLIRSLAPDTPVLLFSYSQLNGTSNGTDALGDITAFNQGVGGDPQNIWRNAAVAFHGYAGYQATADGVKAIIAGGYPAFMTEFYTTPWGGDGNQGMQDIALTGSLEEMGISWLSFLFTPPAPWGLDVTDPTRFKQPIERAGISWTPDFGTWPLPRSPYGNGGKPRDIGIWVNGLLQGKTHLESEEFDNGGEGVAYHDLTPGTNAGNTFRTSEGVEIFPDTGAGGAPFVRASEGEWVEYSVYVREPGDYNLTLRHANASAGSTMRASLGGTELINMPLTPAGNGSAWTTQSQPVFLGTGRAVLRLEMSKGSADLDWFELSPVTAGRIPSGVQKVINRSSGLALACSSPNSGPVVQGQFTGDPTQLWVFKHLGGGQYRITSQANGLLWNRVWYGGSNVDLVWWGFDNPDWHQRYLLRSTADGYYRLAPVDSGYDVGVSSSTGGTPLTQSFTPYAGEVARQWTILPVVTSGTYRIVARHSGKALAASGGNVANGTPAMQWNYTGDASQKWTVTALGNDQYSIIGVQSGRALEISAWGTSDGSKVQLWDYFGGTSQKYVLTPTGGGFYRVSPTHAINSCLDVDGVSMADGTKVQLWTWNGGLNQQWAFQAP